MQVLDRKTTAAAVRKAGAVARTRKGLASLLVTLAFVVGTVSPASAATPDPTTDVTGGAGDTFFTTLTSYFTGHVLISVLALLALTVGVSMLIGWGRKAAKSK